MKKNKAAFTMIEVVIAITILALIFSVAYKGLSQIAESKAILDDEREIIQVANTLMSRISRELQMSVATTNLIDSDNQNYRFRGMNETIGRGNAGDKVIFMANEAGQYIPEGQTHSGIVQLSYFAAKDPQKETFLLVRDEIPDLSDTEKALEQRMTFPITNKLLGLDFAYYDSRSESWQDEWNEQSSIPAMVRVKVTLLSSMGKEMVFSTGIPIKSGVQSQ